SPEIEDPREAAPLGRRRHQLDILLPNRAEDPVMRVDSAAERRDLDALFLPLPGTDDSEELAQRDQARLAVGGAPGRSEGPRKRGRTGERDPIIPLDGDQDLRKNLVLLVSCRALPFPSSGEGARRRLGTAPEPSSDGAEELSSVMKIPVKDDMLASH